MKQKSIPQKPATKSDINMLKTDVNTLKTDVNILKTDVKGLKTDVNILKTDVKGIKDDIKALEIRNNIKMDALKIEIGDEIRQYHDKTMTKLDDIVKELEEMREDRILGAHQTSELRKNVDDHEKRITSLEKARQIA